MSYPDIDPELLAQMKASFKAMPLHALLDLEILDADPARPDTSVCGVDIPEGAAVLINMGSANHDETRWPDPETFDIHRDQRVHIAFASGPHMCLGMHLARMETKVVLNKLLDRLPNLRADPDAEPPAVTGMTFRAPSRLDVVFDV